MKREESRNKAMFELRMMKLLIDKAYSEVNSSDFDNIYYSFNDIEELSHYLVSDLKDYYYNGIADNEWEEMEDDEK